MHEDYVPYEAAKLLKEKEFEWRCHACYDYDKPDKLVFLEGISNPCSIIYAAPTPYIAQKWLRETKGIYIWVEPVIGHRWTVSFCDLNVCAEERDWIERELHKDGYPIYDSYEDALNAGILETLKLI